MDMFEERLRVADRRGMLPAVSLYPAGGGEYAPAGSPASSRGYGERRMASLVPQRLERPAPGLQAKRVTPAAKTAEEKKAFLGRYKNAERRIAALTAEQERWRRKAALLSQPQDASGEQPALWEDGLPSTEKGLRDTLRRQEIRERIGVIQRLLDQEIGEQAALRLQVEEAVAGIQDSRRREVLQYRYIEGMTWEKVAQAMHYSTMQVSRIHADALEAVTLPVG